MTAAKNQVPTIKDFRPFLICSPENYESCKAFYLDIGFEILWDGENVCEFQTGFANQRFLLSLHHGLNSTGHGMLHFWVENVDSWHKYLTSKKLDKKYPDVKVAEPSVSEWGWRIVYVWDPSGTLLHIAEPHSEKNKTFFNSASWL